MVTPPPTVLTTCERFPHQRMVAQAARPRCEHARARLCALSEVTNMRSCVYPDIKAITPDDRKLLHHEKLNQL